MLKVQQIKKRKILVIIDKKLIKLFKNKFFSILFLVKIIKYTGDIPLDEKFTETVGFEYKIYREEEVIYDCMLNQVLIVNFN